MLQKRNVITQLKLRYILVNEHLINLLITYLINLGLIHGTTQYKYMPKKGTKQGKKRKFKSF